MRASKQFIKDNTRDGQRVFAGKLNDDQYHAGYTSANNNEREPGIARTEAFRLGWFDYVDQDIY